MVSKRLAWIRRAVAAFVFGLNTASLLFVSATLFFALWLFSNGARELSPFVLGCFPSAAATICLAGLSFLLPNLVGGLDFRFPLNLTLPTVFCGLTVLMSRLMATLRPPLALIGEAPRVDQVWNNPTFLFICWLGQVAVMTVAARFWKKKEPTE